MSDKGYRLDQLAEIFAVDRDTASAWLTAWDTVGLIGLRDRTHPGRPRRSTEADVVALEADLETAPQRIQALPARFHERTGKRVSLATVKRWLKERHWVWKRCRRSIKAHCNPASFEEGQKVLKAFQDKEAAGDIELFYLDESGFSSGSCVPYAWQRQGSTWALPANVPGRVNVISLMNRQGMGYFHPVETTVTSATVAEAMAGFIQSRPADKLTMVVMDNAPLHKKAVREGQANWLLGRVWVWFLPPYSPELNCMLWKKIKYEWLPWEAYANFEALRNALQDIFQNLGEKYQVNFVWVLN